MEEVRKEILMKNNILIKAKYDLSASENKIFQLILFNFQKEKNSTLVANIPKKEFDKLLKSSASKTEKAISTILLKLRKSDIWIVTPDGWDNYGFINNFGYNNKTETFKIYANEMLYDLLFQYLKGYTPVNLEIFFSLKSYYSQRMYALLRLWSNTKHTINYTIDELKELLMLENKYELYKDFKRRVIKTSVDELNKKCLMQIDFKEIKTGRKVTSIDFIITDNDKRIYFNKENKTIELQEKNKFKDLKFNNFDQRTYDYNDLEKKLLGWDKD